MLDTIRAKARGTAAVTLIAFTTLTVAAPAAQAGIVGTEQALAGATLDSDRAQLVATLERAEVRAALVARGVDPAVVEARVASLTDEEVRALNRNFEQLPAGGDILGVAVFIFLVLLFTDLMGWTDVFPFTKKGSAKG